MHFFWTHKANFPILPPQKRKFLSINHIDGFNAGARRNAGILTEMLKDVPGIQAPDTVEGDHIYVYYPLTLHPAMIKIRRKKLPFWKFVCIR